MFLIMEQKRKMKINSDGFPRITSSSKGVTYYMNIVKVPDDEVNEKGLSHTLIWTGAVEPESESEKSEEEPWSDDDSPMVKLLVEKMSDSQLLLENEEKPKEEVETKAKAVESETEEKKSDNGQSKRNFTGKNKKYSPCFKKNNFESDKRNFNISNRSHQNYDNSSAPNKKNKYKCFPNKDFGASSNFKRKYNTTKSDDIEPWNPWSLAAPFNTPLVFQYPYNSYPVTSLIEQSPQNLNVESDRNSIGLLGRTPYSPNPHNFIPNRSNENFNDNQNCWNNNEYQYVPNDYQRPRHVYRSMGQNYYRWKNKNSKNAWRGKGKDPNGHLDYRK